MGECMFQGKGKFPSDADARADLRHLVGDLYRGFGHTSQAARPAVRERDHQRQGPQTCLRHALYTQHC